jgi:integrase
MSVASSTKSINFPAANFPIRPLCSATERGGLLAGDAINRPVKRIGWQAGLPTVHTHMLRRGRGRAAMLWCCT